MSFKGFGDVTEKIYGVTNSSYRETSITGSHLKEMRKEVDKTSTEKRQYTAIVQPVLQKWRHYWVSKDIFYDYSS